MIKTIADFLFPALDFFHSLTHSWGMAILLFAAAAKTALIPLTNRQFLSMKEMQAIQPEMKRLQEKHKDKPDLFQKEFMALLRSRKVNPFSGCFFSMLIQLPVLWALYYVIRDHITAFREAGFLWIGGFAEKLAVIFPAAARRFYEIQGFCNVSLHLTPSFPFLGTSLAFPDWPLLILYGVSMYGFSKVNAPAAAPDPQAQQTQSTMNLLMPVFSMVIFREFPSAFILYWLMYNLFSVTHQAIFFKWYEAKKVEPVVLRKERN